MNKESMQENQPIISNFIASGYGNKMLSLVVNEKKQIGVAVIKLDSIPEPVNLYWNKEKKQWQDVLPSYIHPNIIDKHYQSAI